MADKLNIGILGGDLRSVFLYESLKADKHKVSAYALGTKSEKGVTLEDFIKKNDYIVLGIPASKDQKNIMAELSYEKIKVDESLKKLLKDKVIFCGMKERLTKAHPDFSELKIIDYAEDEMFKIKNALLTAEAAICVAKINYPESIQKSKCLVCGYGRIAKLLALKLNDLGAYVTIAARNKKAILWANALGYETIDINNIKEYYRFDLIFNTIPKVILDAEKLDKLAKDSLIIELASNPGGVSLQAAENMGIKIVKALGLPAKYTPKTSAEIIKSVIYSYIQGGGDGDI